MPSTTGENEVPIVVAEDVVEVDAGVFEGAGVVGALGFEEGAAEVGVLDG